MRKNRGGYVSGMDSRFLYSDLASKQGHFLHVTGLHGNSAGDARNYGCKEFKDFGDCSPIEFSHNILV